MVCMIVIITICRFLFKGFLKTFSFFTGEEQQGDWFDLQTEGAAAGAGAGGGLS